MANREQLRSQCVLGAFGYAGRVGATQGSRGWAGTLTARAAQRLHEAGAQQLQPLLPEEADLAGSREFYWASGGVLDEKHRGAPGTSGPSSRLLPTEPGTTDRADLATPRGVIVLRCVLPEAGRVRGTQA